MRIEIGWPALSSPSARGSFRICRVRLSGTGSAPLAMASRSEPTPSLRQYALVSRRDGAGFADLTVAAVDSRLHLDVRPDRRGRVQRDLERDRAGVQAAGQRHRLGQRGGEDAVVGAAAVGPLMILLDEAATGDRARGDFL